MDDSLEKCLAGGMAPLVKASSIWDRRSISSASFGTSADALVQGGEELLSAGAKIGNLLLVLASKPLGPFTGGENRPLDEVDSLLQHAAATKAWGTKWWWHDPPRSGWPPRSNGSDAADLEVVGGRVGRRAPSDEVMRDDGA